jgi:hypothetical protein
LIFTKKSLRDAQRGRTMTLKKPISLFAMMCSFSRSLRKGV